MKSTNHQNYKKQQHTKTASQKIVRGRLRWFAIAIGVVAIGVATTVAFAVTPTNGGTVGGSTIVVDNSAGEQIDPHVSGNIAAYTDTSDASGPVIRYYDFLNPVTPNAAITGGFGDEDTLSDVNGNHIAFSRYNSVAGTHACMVFDVFTHNTTQIGSGVAVGATALGSDTVAFVGNGDIIVGRISQPLAPLTNLSASSNFETTPAVSPSGSLVVWASCTTPLSGCDIMKATLSGGVWSAPTVVWSAPAANPDTDGTNIVYDSNGDIYYQSAGGGAATQLVIDGVQLNPSIAEGVITFESSVDGTSQADLFVYQISTNTLFRVTDTPGTNESLNDVTVLAGGDVRVVWAANDDSSAPDLHNIYARTFTLPQALPNPNPSYNFSGFFQPVDNLPTPNIASAGSSIPVRFSLGGNYGLAIFAAGYPKSSPIACDANEPGATIEETVTAGNSSLSYDATADLYSYVWKTDRGWRGTCRMLVVKLNDGSEHFAKFRFK